MSSRRVPYPSTPDPVKKSRNAQATAIVARVERMTQEVQRVMDSVPPPASLPTSDVPDRLLAEAMASNAELSLMVLQRLTKMDVDIQEIKKWRSKQESVEERATDILLQERRSKMNLEEEITRADIQIKKVRSEKIWTIAAKVLAVVMTPPGVWSVIQWVKDHFQ
jgi:hypothetical protein